MPGFYETRMQSQKDAESLLKKETLTADEVMAVYNMLLSSELSALNECLERGDRQASRFAFYRALYLKESISNLDSLNLNTITKEISEKESNTALKKYLKTINDGSLFTTMNFYCRVCEEKGVKPAVDKIVGRYIAPNDLMTTPLKL